MAPSPQALPEALSRILDCIADPANAQRFQTVFESATDALGALSELDLSDYEREEFELGEQPLWEYLAPAVRDTINAVNAFLETVRNQFPLTVRDGELHVDDAFDTIFGPPVPESTSEADFPWSDEPQTLENKLKEVIELLLAICEQLSKDVTEFGEAVRRPSVVSDRWYLLDHVSACRGRFRAGIGEMLYQAAQVFSEVSKEEVVPHYAADLKDATELRRALTLLRRRSRIIHSRLQQANDAAEAQDRIRELLEQVHIFTKEPSYAVFRAADKRSVIHIRHDLKNASTSESLTVRQAIRLSDGFARFLETLTTINRREHLTVNDQDAASHAEMKLADAVHHLMMNDLREGRELLTQAMAQSQRIFGRSDSFDDILRVLSKIELRTLALDDLLAVAETLQQQLLSLPEL